MKGCSNKFFIVILLVLSIGLIIYSFYLLSILTQDIPTDESALKFEVLGRTLRFDSYTGQVGDAIGGLLNPFIGMSAIIVTGLAFYMQYQANEMVRKQFELQKFETQFYEMLRLHKENVNEMEFSSDNNIFKGRKAFSEMAELLNYTIICDPDNPDAIYDGEDRDVFQKNVYKGFYDKYGKYIGHYFRHLFHTVKFVANQKMIDEDKKKEYLRILRVQMSNDEQQLLFYNWLAPSYGGAWENDTNQFFTKYKMIHNLWYNEFCPYPLILNELKKLVEIYEKEEENDCLFEIGDNIERNKGSWLKPIN